MTIQPYEPGSQVAVGMEILKAQRLAHIAEGIADAKAKRTPSKLWSRFYEQGYQMGIQLVELEESASLYTGDPAVAQWASEGAPSCGATWEDDYNVDIDANRDDYIGE